MKLLITGAGGFLGRNVVASAVQRGHDVRAMVRPAGRPDPSWEHHPKVELVKCDLRAATGIDEALEGVDAVIHLAATKAGDLYEQFGGTVIATENLLAAMDRTSVRRIVTSSSFSVYEYLNRWAWSMLDETSPLATHPEQRDEYCQTKLVQEQLVRQHAADRHWQSVILRPGVIYGRDNLWTARLGAQLSEKYWLRIGGLAPLPLTYVENCAEAIVLAAEYAGPERDLVLNVVDDVTPSQRAYLRKLQAAMPVRPRIIPVPWTVIRGAARLAWLTNRIFFGGTAKVPGIFVPCKIHARCKSLRYSNARIRVVLGWEPRFTWQQGITRAVADDDPATLALAQVLNSQPH